MKYLYYQVIGKGGVLASHRKKPNSKEFVFQFWATFAMVPEAALVVYYYRPNGEIIADRVELKFEDRLDNYVRRIMTETMNSKINCILYHIPGQHQTVRHKTRTRKIS
jgi:Alpha-2-macroglobulin bait region domain